ncbi:excalibur calcium-binding domain-containing protein [Corynebacterium pacaense]|uniref:excalibur calcium-binding domain-containing protein n=1 Tax=Corynebacterium pacaense TaxID=1816684 RepID=UPI001FE5C63B|nr:excalibur calcium-binding domain-containing protein [Corynebacterium pacaense]
MNTAPSTAKWKSILAWVSVVFGACSLISLFSSGSVGGAFGSLLMSIAFGLPGAWWMYCNARDRKAASAYGSAMKKHIQLTGLLRETDPTIVMGMGTPDAPATQKRRWPVVAGASVAVAFIGASLLPTPEPGVAPAVSTTTASPTAETTSPVATTTRTTSRKPTTRTSTSTPTTLAQSVEPTTEQPAPPVGEAPVVQQGFAAIPAAPVVEEAPAPAPAPVPAAPAPAPASASYKNCTAVWNAIGGPIYSGNPGYAGHLDSDGDGIGCEKDPR